MTSELTTIPTVELELDIVRDHGCVVFSLAELDAIGPKKRTQLFNVAYPEDMAAEKAQIDFLVKKLRAAGLPIDNESIIWTRQFKIAAANALKRCGAEILSVTIDRSKGTSVYEWGKRGSMNTLSYTSHIECSK